MNLGLRMFAFIQQRDVMIVKRSRIRPYRKYECDECPRGEGGVYVNTPDKTQECHCVACGQPYLVILAEDITE